MAVWPVSAAVLTSSKRKRRVLRGGLALAQMKGRLSRRPWFFPLAVVELDARTGRRL